MIQKKQNNTDTINEGTLSQAGRPYFVTARAVNNKNPTLFCDG
jgi:hypothetical protein